MTQELRRGQMVPNFTLPDAGGMPIRRSSYRGRKHLALVFLADDDHAAEAVVRDLADVSGEIKGASAEVLVIVRGSAVVAQQLATSAGERFPVLIDADGAVTERFLPPGMVAGAFLTDRYGELYAALTVPQGQPFPPVAELVTWLTAIDHQCAI